MQELLLRLNSGVNSMVWGVPVIILMLGTGLYFTVRTGFFQFRGIPAIFKRTIGSLFGDAAGKEENSMSPAQAFFTSLGATVGTGSVAGVGAAIAVGGAGAVFWMWVSAAVGMMLSFAENVLGGIYRKKNSDGSYSGGAMYYMEKGLGSPRLGKAFALCCVFASFGMGNMAQTNSVSGAMSHFGVPSWVTGIACAALLIPVIAGGGRAIGKFSQRTVPFIAAAYILGSLAIILMNLSGVIPSFRLIFSEAFNVKSAVGGGIGTVISTGFRRGIFSSEAGLGTTVAVHGGSGIKKPCEQGMWGIFEVFTDTMVICTLTALAILSSGADYSSGSENVIVVKAFESGFDSFGGAFVALASACFAFATLIGWSLIGLSAWDYIFPGKSGIYKFVFVICAVLGAVTSMKLALGLSDTFNGLMMIPNLTALILLRRQVVSEFHREFPPRRKSRPGKASHRTE